MNQLISLILPVYNVESYIEQCIRSIQSQTYRDFETIVIDDGSTDRSINMVAALTKDDERFNIVRQSNKGLGEARNTGLTYVRGTYVIFVDGDDWIDSRMLELLVAQIQYNDADLVCCGYNIVHMGRVLPFPQEVLRRDKKGYISMCLNEVHKDVPSITTTVWAAMFRVKIIRENKIQFKLKFYEDSPFFFEFVSCINSISFVSTPLYNYLVRGRSISQSYPTREKISSFYKADRYIEELLIKAELFRLLENSYNSFHVKRIVLYGGYAAFFFRSGPDNSTIRFDSFKFFLEYLTTQKVFLSRLSKENKISPQRSLANLLLYGIDLGESNIHLAMDYFSKARGIIKDVLYEF